ncbi:MAG: hypothetical protein ABIJ19_00230 [Patescibacteria group bacterium]
MEEKKVVDFPVRKTENVESFRVWAPQNCKEVFDNMPIKEIREVCLKQMNSDLEDNVGWLVARVKTYVLIGDYETVCMLLRTLCQHQYSESQRIVDLMVDAIRFGMINNYDCARRNIKDMLVILCGKLQYANDLYNENTRKLFQEIIEKFYERSVYGSDDKQSQLISRVLFVIAAVKDKTFISILEKIRINKINLAHLMEYVSISKERISLEGLTMIVLRYLKGE